MELYAFTLNGLVLHLLELLFNLSRILAQVCGVFEDFLTSSLSSSAIVMPIYKQFPNVFPNFP